MDVKLPKLGGLLHDIGRRSITTRKEPSAAGDGSCGAHGEAQPVLDAIGYHHDDHAGGSLWPVLWRPPTPFPARVREARRESIEIYIKRLEALRRSPARSPASRSRTPSRPARDPHPVSTPGWTTRAPRTWRRDPRGRIEKELEYPGQIRVTVIRETRAVDYAK